MLENKSVGEVLSFVKFWQVVNNAVRKLVLIFQFQNVSVGLTVLIEAFSIALESHVSRLVRVRIPEVSTEIFQNELKCSMSQRSCESCDTDYIHSYPNCA